MATHYLLYVSKCIPTDKIYVGQHATNNLGDGYIGSGQNMKQAIAKYGRGAFVFQVIRSCKDREELNEWESFIVTESFVGREDNYNLQTGGLGHSHGAETRRKLSLAHTGKKRSAASIEKRAAAMRGRKQSPEQVQKRMRSMRGYKHSPATRAKISQRRKGVLLSESHRAAIGRSLLGRKRPPEVVEKTARALRGRTVPRDQTERAAETKSHVFPPIVHRVTGERVSGFRGITKFARQRGLSKSTFMGFIQGRAPSCHGWVFDKTMA